MISFASRLSAALDVNPFLPLHSAVTNILRECIITCELEPNMRLLESDVAQSFGISRTTVRQAFEELMRENLVIKNRGQGVSVAGIASANDTHAVELRIAVEPYATRLAAMRRTPEDLAVMKAFLDMAQTTDDCAQFARADIGFHSTIYSATRNSYIINAAQLIMSDQSRLKMYSSSRIMTVERERVNQEHLAIFTAIRQQNHKEAYRAGLQHAKIPLDPSVKEATYGSFEEM